MTFAVSVILPYESGLPTDVGVNTWHFNKSSGIAEDFDNLRDALKDFYTTTPPEATFPISEFLSPLIDGPALVKVWDLNDTKPRIPAYEASFPITTSGTALPSEVAICFSYQAERQSGVPQARRRNRVYLGPLNTFSNDNARVKGTVRSTIMHASKALHDATAGGLMAWRWQVRSETLGSTWDVHDGWVDDAFDTMRSRGRAATGRNTVTY